jgi:hypothetical protein
MGELAMSPEEREKNAIYSGHLRLCQQPRAAHALRSDQDIFKSITRESYNVLNVATNSIKITLSSIVVFNRINKIILYRIDFLG